MRDRADRAGRLASVAADADFGVDQVLPDNGCVGRLHHARVLAANMRDRPSRTSLRARAKQSMNVARPAAWIASSLRSSQ